MNLDDMKESWAQKHRELDHSGVDELTSLVLARASDFEKKILRRDQIETAAAVIVIVCSGYAVRWTTLPWIAKLGMAMVLLGAVEVVVVINWTRRRGRRQHRDLPLTEFCAAEIARVDRQIWLSRNVSWWYSGALLAGACVFLFGILFSVPVPLHIAVPGFSLYCLLMLVLGKVIHGMNQRALSEELVPLRDELSAILKSLRDDSSNARLRE